MQIDNVLTNRQLYKKAYMIEFYGTDKNKPDEVFTFSLPPENEELTYSQRKTETKTFGGLHVDEYGIDAVKVVLSGSTINQSLKRIYKGGFGSDKYLSGEDEIYYFRDLLRKYRSLENLKNDTCGKIYIYDLSKFTGYQSSVILDGATKNCWQAFPGDFKIRRSSDKPFAYKYSFEFTGVPIDANLSLKFEEESSSSGSKKLGWIQATTNALKSVLDFVDDINGWCNNVLDHVNKVSSLLKLLGNVMSYSTNTLTGIMDSVGNAATGLIDGASSVIDGANTIMSLPRTVQLKALNIGLDVYNATGGLMKSTASLAENCRGMFAEDGEYWEIPQEVLDQYGMTSEEFQDSILRMCGELENAANEIHAESKSKNIPDVTTGNPDPETGEPRIVLSYGSTEVMLKSTDTLESLASEYMGSPDKAIDIATFNGVATLNDLQPGAIIRIPITSRTAEIINNLIYAMREERDNYGRDILLTDDGNIVSSNSGDYELADGAKNLSQAILLRLRESVQKRIRQIAYGIRTNISDPAAGIAYIISSINLTVNSEPRVSAVEDIQFRGEGDSLNVNVMYRDINKTSGNVSGRV